MMVLCNLSAQQKNTSYLCIAKSKRNNKVKMSITKNALIRYKVLDKCFRNTGKKYYINDLIEECNNALSEIDPDSDGISLRTIRGDIAFMKSSEGWSIELGEYKDGKKKYYRYADPNFSINNMPLNEVEINQLQSAIQILSQFKGMPQFEWMEELIPKLNQGIQLSCDVPKIMEFSANEFIKGSHYISDIYNAIFYKKVLRIKYQPFNFKEPIDLNFHPYYLKQYNQRWYAFGYNPEFNKADWNLALDRIEKIDEVADHYVENTQIEWQEYFEDMIGVTKSPDSSVSEILLRVTGPMSKYMEVKPLHGSQKSKWIDNETLEIRLSLIINKELENQFMAHIDSIEVLSPPELKQNIVARLKKGLERNSSERKRNR
jgi:predicted DNA-binding transcriptional regulator YafY